MSDITTFRRGKLTIALVIAAVIIVALIAWNILLNSQIAVLQTDNNYLQNNVSGLQNDKTFLQHQIQQFQDENKLLRFYIEEYQSILNLSRSVNIYPLQDRIINAGTSTFIGGMNLDYAGYLEVTLNSTSPSTFVLIEYSSKAGDLNFQKTLGTYGTEIFFILPTPFMKFSIGNTEASGTVRVVFTVTYYY